MVHSRKHIVILSRMHFVTFIRVYNMHQDTKSVRLIAVCKTYLNRSQMTSVCKEQKSTTQDKVEWHDHCSLHTVTSSVIYYRCTEKCNIFVLYDKNSNGLFKNLAGIKKEKQVRWHGFDAICVSLIDRGHHNQWKCTQKSCYCIIHTKLTAFL